RSGEDSTGRVAGRKLAGVERDFSAGQQPRGDDGGDRWIEPTAAHEPCWSRRRGVLVFEYATSVELFRAGHRVRRLFGGSLQSRNPGQPHERRWAELFA